LIDLIPLLDTHLEQLVTNNDDSHSNDPRMCPNKSSPINSVLPEMDPESTQMSGQGSGNPASSPIWDFALAEIDLAGIDDVFQEYASAAYSAAAAVPENGVSAQGLARQPALALDSRSGNVNAPYDFEPNEDYGQHDEMHCINGIFILSFFNFRPFSLLTLF
jgi:hypothetical protein